MCTYGSSRRDLIYCLKEAVEINDQTVYRYTQNHKCKDIKSRHFAKLREALEKQLTDASSSTVSIKRFIDFLKSEQEYVKPSRTTTALNQINMLQTTS